MPWRKTSANHYHKGQDFETKFCNQRIGCLQQWIVSAFIPIIALLFQLSRQGYVRLKLDSGAMVEASGTKQGKLNGFCRYRNFESLPKNIDSQEDERKKLTHSYIVRHMYRLRTKTQTNKKAIIQTFIKSDKHLFKNWTYYRNKHLLGWSS